MSDDERGFYPKYMVHKAQYSSYFDEVLPSGEPLTDVFVLRPEKDSAALVALRAYAEATVNEALASDLTDWIERIEER